MTGGSGSTRDWMLDQLLDDGAARGAPAVRSAVDIGSPDPDIAGAAADSGHGVAGDGGAPAATDPDAGARRILRGLLAGVGATAVLIVAGFAGCGGGRPAAPAATHRAGPAPAPSSARPVDPVAPQQDQSVPYTPTTDSCPGGPTSPLALTGNGTVWVCSRGPQESPLDGQVLHVTFSCGRSRPEPTCSYMLSAVSVTPGWISAAGSTDQWLQHRVVTRVQFNFFNGDKLATDPFVLDTNGIHGPVSATLPSRVLASRADVLILRTDRPSAAPTSAGSPPAPAGTGGVLGADPLGAPGAPATTDGDPGGRDPVDATFAISQLSFLGHPPS